MLPGLRFVFAAIIFSLSLLIFGLGAAALFRSAHEEFVSLPNRRAQPETAFAPPPTLAMLRVDAPTAERNPTGAAPDANLPNAAPPSDPPPSLAITESDKPAALQERIAALTDALPEAVKSASIVPTISTVSTEAPVQAAAPPETAAVLEVEKPELKTAEQKPEVTAAANPETTSSAATVVVDIVAVPAPMDEGAKAAARKVATLGGPEVVVDPRAAASKPASSKRAHHRKHRRIVARPRVVSPKPPDTFGLFDTQPTPPQAAPRGRQNRQAGPVASAGPSGKPHSAHDPS